MAVDVEVRFAGDGVVVEDVLVELAVSRAEECKRQILCAAEPNDRIADIARPEFEAVEPLLLVVIDGRAAADRIVRRGQSQARSERPPFLAREREIAVARDDGPRLLVRNA